MKELIKRSEAAGRICSVNQMLLKKSQNLHENTCAGGSF